MADSISVQNLKDAKVDAGDLAEFTNGEDNQTVTSRLGKQYPSIAKLVKDFNTDATNRLNANDATALSHLNANDATALSHLNANDVAASDQRAAIQAAGNVVLAGLSYGVPVAYTAGLSMTLPTQTVQYNGQTYAPKLGDLPFTTSGTFETAKFRLIQGVSSADLASNIGSSLVGFLQSGTGAVLRTNQSKNRDILSVKDFGAVGDGVTDDTAAIQKTIDYLLSSLTNPTGVSTNRGVGKILFPKGKYLTGPLTIGTQMGTRVFGFEFFGDGEYASSIIFSQNTGTLFSFSAYNSIIIHDIAIIHSDVVNIQTNRDSWTNTAFNLDGTGAGRHFTLNRVTTHGFNVLISMVKNIGNNDTTFIDGCTFLDGNTFLYCRNNEAVVNSIRNTTFGTEWRKVFDLAGFGHTTVQNCNIVVSGTVLYLSRSTPAYDSKQNSRYVFDNCKLELYAPYGAASNATTKLLEVADDLTSAVVFYRNCTLAGGKNPDPAIFQFDLTGARVSVFNDYCFYRSDMKIRLGSSSSVFGTLTAFKFNSCDSVIPPANITFLTLGVGYARIPVVYKDCTGVSDFSLMKDCSEALISGFQKTFSPRNGGFLALGNTSVDFDYPMYGQTTLLKNVRILVASKSGTTSAEVLVYSDSARTVLIGSVTIPNIANANPALYEITLPANYINTTGFYFRVNQASAGGSMTGKINLEYVNF